MSLPLTTINPLYVVDTNALIWYLLNDVRLGKHAKRVFEAAERGETHLLISAVALAEMYFADKKYQFFDDFRSIFQRLRASPYIRFVAFEAEDVLDFAIDAAVPEMHDRIIAGLARRFDAPILTSDRKIAEANIVTVVWE